jgi:ubiquinone/menaquinone biosynthesis C-methylase UbiE
MKGAVLAHGDFTGLAGNYSKFRPGYSETVLAALLGITRKPAATLDCADVGAGTGIWTRMLAGCGVKTIVAVEPNDDMRAHGEAGNGNLPILWRKGSGEATGLAANSVNLLSMASSFHWVNFEAGMQEFHRVLKSGGHFAALWNPRHIQDNPMLVDIERKLTEMCPSMTRVSSGKSAFVEELAAKFRHHPLFTDPVYLEARHTMQLTQEQYIGVWQSVNDVRAQLGEAAFAKFMDYVRSRITTCATIDCTYLTRAWIMRVQK